MLPGGGGAGGVPGVPGEQRRPDMEPPARQGRRRPQVPGQQIIYTCLSCLLFIIKLLKKKYVCYSNLIF